MEASEAEAKTMSIAVSDVKKRVDREDGFEKEEPYLMVNEEKDSTAWIAFCPAELQKPPIVSNLYSPRTSIKSTQVDFNAFPC